MKNSTTIHQEKLETSSAILRALAHPLRMKIIEFIDQNEEVNVNKIYSTLHLEQSITSQHLRILRQSNLVETQRMGKYVFYSLNYERIQQASLAVAHFDELTPTLILESEE
ncbi:MAG: metalloregulator ArsR/SmtB family transcription factor [Bacteroidota bacterium]